MRRKDREINDYNEILAIMKKCDSCSVAFYDEDFPYVIPLNFGVKLVDGKFELYLHGANAGKKIDLLKRNNHVAFEMNCNHELRLSDNVCKSTMGYESVCGNGILKLLEDNEKINGLTALMNQFDNAKEYNFNENVVNAIAVLKIEVNDICGKRLELK